jgi:hypothetical protein
LVLKVPLGQRVKQAMSVLKVLKDQWARKATPGTPAFKAPRATRGMPGQLVRWVLKVQPARKVIPAKQANGVQRGKPDLRARRATPEM